MASGGLAPYIQVHFQRMGEPGYVGLCVAENHQVRDLLLPRLDDVPPLPAAMTGYDQMTGRPALREALADVIGREVVGRSVDPAHVQVLAGAGGVLDALGHALGDPGDGVLVPTPSYSGFWPDLEVRPGLVVVPVPTTAEDGFRVTPSALERAWAVATVPVRILLLTNPDNPRGQVMTAGEVEAVLRWADGRGLHVIADEVYALSTFGPRPFASVGRLRPVMGDRLHLVWAVSKDLGLSGLRCGVVLSEHAALRDALELQGSWAGVSSHTQHVLATMLADRDWFDRYLGTMRGRLRDAAAAVTAALAVVGIPHLAPDAGFFLLVDLRPHLGEPTWAAEQALWAHILDTTGVNLTPGSALRAPEPGWFRLCYASVPLADVLAAVERIGAAVRS